MAGKGWRLGPRQAQLQPGSGVPKGTLRFGDLPEGLIELRKAIRLEFVVCCSKRTQIGISKGTWGGVQESPGVSFRSLMDALHCPGSAV